MRLWRGDLSSCPAPLPAGAALPPSTDAVEASPAGALDAASGAGTPVLSVEPIGELVPLPSLAGGGAAPEPAPSLAGGGAAFVPEVPLVDGGAAFAVPEGDAPAELLPDGAAAVPAVLVELAPLPLAPEVVPAVPEAWACDAAVPADAAPCSACGAGEVGVGAPDEA